MSKYSDKTFEKILDEMPNRVKECDALEGTFIYTVFASFAIELALYSMFTKYTYGVLRTMTHKYMREHYFGEDGHNILILVC